MVLGDNIFYGNGFRKILKEAVDDAEVNGLAKVFGYYVNDPKRFSVVAFDEEERAISIEKNRQSQSQTMQSQDSTYIREMSPLAQTRSSHLLVESWRLRL